MNAGDLTTLEHLKSWLNLPNTESASDELLRRLIRSASAFVLNFMNRETLALSQYAETYDGYGNSFMVLRRGPVYEVTGLSFAGTIVNAASGDGFSTPYTNGYVVEPEYSIIGSRRLNLYGRCFPRARGSIAIRYTAGYVTKDCRVTIPGDLYQYTTRQTWIENVSVSGVNGEVFEQVAADPQAGQYTINSDGQYTFNAADAGTVVDILYSFVPPDIEQAVWELAGERFRYMDRIGVVSKSLGGQETVSFSQKSMSDYVHDLLSPYRQVVPVG